jgi:arginase family enzyme
MIDPRGRWSAVGEKPDHAGLLTFAGLPYTEDAADLARVDAAIVGAPMDDLLSDRPGTSFAPRAIRAASSPPGPHLEAGVDAFEELRVVDFGDARSCRATPAARTRRSRRSWERCSPPARCRWSSAATTRSPSRA